jgi:hypothetical protein
MQCRMQTIDHAEYHFDHLNQGFGQFHPKHTFKSMKLGGGSFPIVNCESIQNKYRFFAAANF